MNSTPAAQIKTEIRFCMWNMHQQQPGYRLALATEAAEKDARDTAHAAGVCTDGGTVIILLSRDASGDRQSYDAEGPKRGNTVMRSRYGGSKLYITARQSSRGGQMRFPSTPSTKI